MGKVKETKMTITIEDKIKAVEREISMRCRVYPRFVENKRMTQEKADREIEIMEAVLETLKEARRQEQLL